MRRQLAAEWEEANPREYLYAGPGRGADIAAWKQGARAELASVIPDAEYVQCLLDLVKAFDRVPYQLLIREAKRLGYPLWVMRLSIATYTEPRRIRIDGAVSGEVVAKRGVTAGSWLATAEMRVVVINIVDNALKVAPCAMPILFVDDLSVESSGGPELVCRNVIKFTVAACAQIGDENMEVSKTKSICTASTMSTGKKTARSLRRHGIKFQKNAISLGAALGAGRRRNTENIINRLRKFKKRLPRFRRMGACGVDSAKLLRTGAVKAMTYGQALIGVGNSALQHQRRAAATAAAGMHGALGKCVDLALVMADASDKGCADPAYDAHCMPIKQYAQAVWHSWLPHNALERMVDEANEQCNRAKSVWSRVKGPIMAMVASAHRLQWKVKSAFELETDSGKLLNLKPDPPIIIKKEVNAAVGRWRWNRVAEKHEHMRVLGQPQQPEFGPVWKILQGKSDKGDKQTKRQVSGSLKSAIANRQWTQSRCWQAGFVNHNKCLLCANDYYHNYVKIDGSQQSHVAKRGKRSETGFNDTKNHRGYALLQPPNIGVSLSSGLSEGAPSGSAQGAHVASCASSELQGNCNAPNHQGSTQLQVGNTDVSRTKATVDKELQKWIEDGDLQGLDIPISDRNHKVWHCPKHEALRQSNGSECMVGALNNVFELDGKFKLAHTIGLLPKWQFTLSANERQPREDSFRRVVKPRDDAMTVKARFYTDGSRIDEKHQETLRVGWSFIAVGENREVIASARGTPPEWVIDIPGAEAWALVQAAMHAELGSDFRSDCQPCVNEVEAGPTEACKATKPLARVMSILHFALDDYRKGSVVWMPAFEGIAAVGVKELPNGEKLARADVSANKMADEQAKIAAHEFRTSERLRQDLKQYDENMRDAAWWLGMVTWEANHQPPPVCRDTGASRFKANIAKRKKEGQQSEDQQSNNKQPPPKKRWIRAVEDGGHSLTPCGVKWKCTRCKIKWPLHRLAGDKCIGSAVDRWAHIVEELKPIGVLGRYGHQRMLSNQLVWCNTCGAYADETGRGMARPCIGAPSKAGRGR